MMAENLALPVVTQVLGQDVTVIEIDMTPRDEIVAVCLRGKEQQSIPILDLPIPDPLPEGAKWIEAYRRWCGVKSAAEVGILDDAPRFSAADAGSN